MTNERRGNMKRNKININDIGLFASALLVTFSLSNCSAGVKTGGKTVGGTLGVSGLGVYKDAVIKVYEPGGVTPVYNSKAFNPEALAENTDYIVNISVADVPEGTPIVLSATNLDLTTQPERKFNLVVGDNLMNFSDEEFGFPAPGLYRWKIKSDEYEVIQEFEPKIACSDGTFTKASLNPGAISVSGSDNIYTFSAAGVTSGANGVGPYKCAWDPTGTGIVSTNFRDCDLDSSLYVNYVGQRNVGLIVQDSCYISHNISIPRTLTRTYPQPMPGNLFIYGKIFSDPDPNGFDSRIDGVEYLALNKAAYPVIQEPIYAAGAFSINASYNFGVGSSVPFGVMINIKGFVESPDFNFENATGTIDDSGAYIESLVYTTDQSGDSRSSRQLAAYDCHWTPQTRLKLVKGSPCETGETGSNSQMELEVWGNYVCATLKNGTKEVEIDGSFDGMYKKADACIGGGKGGGGTLPPAF
jgi:hypothetical protein